MLHSFHINHVGLGRVFCLFFASGGEFEGRLGEKDLINRPSDLAVGAAEGGIVAQLDAYLVGFGGGVAAVAAVWRR